MDVGVCLFNGQQHPDDSRSRTAVYDEMVEHVATADRVGLDSAWVSEHHFTDDGYLSAPLPTLGAFAAATEQITIGTSMLIAPLYDAVRVAEDAAALSLLSDGRMVLGLTNGYRTEEFDQFGVDKADRAAKTEEAVRIARGAWSEGPLGFDPRFHPATAEANITPVPDDPPRITLGGTSKPAVRRAALLGDAWTATETLSTDGVRKRARYQRRLRDVEKLDGEFTTYVQRYCFVDDSTAAAWDRLREPMFAVQRRYDELSAEGSIDRLSEERRQQLEDRAVFGTSEEVVEELRAFEDTVGDDVHVLLRPYLPGIEPEAVRECIERLGEEVAPELR